LEPSSLPESDGHRDHGGIGGSKNKYFFSHRIPAFNARKINVFVCGGSNRQLLYHLPPKKHKNHQIKRHGSLHR
jgi:hypothetical protein